MFRPHVGHYSRRGGGPRRGGSGVAAALIKEVKTLKHIERFIAESNSNPIPAAPAIAVTHSFTDFELSASTQQAITQSGFTQPTPIQERVIPLVLEGNDLIGIANTGTGKTGAFLLPLITRIQRRATKRVLIMAPTRELAVQIQQDFYRFSKDSGLQAALCIGGTSVRQQIQSLRRNYEFLIGTPGRIKDMIAQGEINMLAFDTVVLDEVDRMLDMGFIRDVRDILTQLPSKRQSLFFSATMPAEVAQLCDSFSHSPITISVKTTEYAHSVDQRLLRVEAGKRKLEVLYDLLCDQKEFNKVIIFGRTKHGVKRLAEELGRRGFSVDSIHGNKSQNYRERSLARFKRHDISILVATDIAARGIDVVDITHVINYDLPESIEDYVHRIGRTGRAGKDGVAITLVESSQGYVVR